MPDLVQMVGRPQKRHGDVFKTYSIDNRDHQNQMRHPRIWTYLAIELLKLEKESNIWLWDWYCQQNNKKIIWQSNYPDFEERRSRPIGSLIGRLQNFFNFLPLSEKRHLIVPSDIWLDFYRYHRSEWIGNLLGLLKGILRASSGIFSKRNDNFSKRRWYWLAYQSVDIETCDEIGIFLGKYRSMFCLSGPQYGFASLIVHCPDQHVLESSNNLSLSLRPQSRRIKHCWPNYTVSDALDKLWPAQATQLPPLEGFEFILKCCIWVIVVPETGRDLARFSFLHVIDPCTMQRFDSRTTVFVPEAWFETQPPLKRQADSCFLRISSTCGKL
jgi:hypothetical protein